MVVATAAAVAVVTVGTTPASAKHPPDTPVAQELVTFAAPDCAAGCGSGSTVGPDGKLYVTDGDGGRVLRVHPRTGAITPFATGLPPVVDEAGAGGAMDVAFLGHTAYVLVTLVGPYLGQPGVVNGIYRINRDGSPTVVADLGTWSAEHPPATDSFVPSGVQYAIQAYRGGLLVTDGHHNRVLWVSRNGDIREVIAFGNIVPTGLEVAGPWVLMGQAGPIPHTPETGKIVAFTPRWPHAFDVASGASLIVDVEFGRGFRLYGLSQGDWDLEPIPANEGAPATPDTGRIVRVNREGGFTPVVEGLDRPTSLEFIRDTAFVITLTGKVMRIDGV
jgi:hypothetical protein